MFFNIAPFNAIKYSTFQRHKTQQRACKCSEWAIEAEWWLGLCFNQQTGRFLLVCFNQQTGWFLFVCFREQTGWFLFMCFRQWTGRFFVVCFREQTSWFLVLCLRQRTVWFFFVCSGTFSLWCHPKLEDRCHSVVEFIERAIMHSKNGKFLYFLRSRVPGRSGERSKVGGLAWR